MNGPTGNESDASLADVEGAEFAATIRHRRRLALVAFLATAGVGAIIAGWFGVSGTRVISDQLSYLASGSAIGLALIGVAGGVLLSDYQAEQRRRLDELTNALRGLRETLGAAPRRTTAAALTDGSATNGSRIDLLAAVPGAQRVHVASCAMVHGKPDLRRLTPADAMADGLRACRVCAPDLGAAAADSNGSPDA